MTSQVIKARPGTLIVNSPLRHATGALAVSAGFAYVLEAEDQFHRSVWFGVMIAGLTGAWFILGSFLALIDTIAVWWTVVVLVILALGLWGVLLAVLVAVSARADFVDAPAALAELAGAPLRRGRGRWS